MATTLKLTRRGSFTVEQAKDTATQCGLEGTQKLFYRVEITCTPDALDENGFLIDQLEIHKYMTERHRTMDKFPSCERLSLQCLEEIRAMCSGVLEMEVTVGMNEKAFMTAHWSIR